MLVISSCPKPLQLACCFSLQIQHMHPTSQIIALALVGGCEGPTASAASSMSLRNLETRKAVMSEAVP